VLTKHLPEKRAISDDSGQDMVEYALIMGLISIVAIAALTATGTVIQEYWDSLAASIASIF
jgi:Flp pilus assembly pilin Flp